MENKEMINQTIIETGLLIPGQGYVQASGDSVDLDNYPEGTQVIEVKPSAFHNLEGTTWVLDEAKKIEAESQQVRAERANILSTVVDPLVSNPLRWDSLTTEKQDEWAAYRISLLDLTEQANFPNNIIWPTKPE
jgi:hypothetical protein